MCLNPRCHDHVSPGPAVSAELLPRVRGSGVGAHRRVPEHPQHGHQPPRHQGRRVRLQGGGLHHGAARKPRAG